ncbi:MAG: hypothetical protein ACI4V4_07085 [Eubacterium sp.]
MDKIDLPLGFGMALAQNEPAMKRFEMMSEAQKAEIINKSHSVNSKQEMQNLVNSLSQNSI